MQRSLRLFSCLIVPAALIGLGSSVVARAKVGGVLAPDGKTALYIDLPASQHLRNKGGTDGAGLCVFTSAEHSMRWAGMPLDGFRDWMAQNHRGGGWPEKLTSMLRAYCLQKGVSEPDYFQVLDGDLEILKAACKNGRMPCVTYAFSPTGRYRGRIAHMVNIVHCDDNWVCVLDNNFPGVNNYEWMTPAEFRRVFTTGGPWAVIFLHHGPPPPPRN